MRGRARRLFRLGGILVFSGSVLWGCSDVEAEIKNLTPDSCKSELKFAFENSKFDNFELGPVYKVNYRDDDLLKASGKVAVGPVAMPGADVSIAMMLGRGFENSGFKDSNFRILYSLRESCSKNSLVFDGKHSISGCRVNGCKLDGVLKNGKLESITVRVPVILDKPARELALDQGICIVSAMEASAGLWGGWMSDGSDDVQIVNLIQGDGVEFAWKLSETAVLTHCSNKIQRPSAS